MLWKCGNSCSASVLCVFQGFDVEKIAASFPVWDCDGPLMDVRASTFTRVSKYLFLHRKKPKEASAIVR